MAGYLRVDAERRKGVCVLRMAGDLDASMADALTDYANAAVQAIPGAVLVDLSGLSLIDAHGARALAALIQDLAATRLTAVRACPPNIRRTMELLGLPPDYLSAGDGATAGSKTVELVTRLRLARLDAGEVKDDARRMLARLTDTCIRMASTRERTGLVVEQGRHAVASSKAAREHLRQIRQGAAT